MSVRGFPSAVITWLAVLAVTSATGASAAGDRSLAVPVMPPPVIDGVIGDAEWDTAVVTTLDFQTQPGDNLPPSVRTEVRIGADNQRLYLAFLALDDDAGGVRGRVTRRDDIFGDDYVTLYLDTYDDRRRAYVFSFNRWGYKPTGSTPRGSRRGATSTRTSIAPGMGSSTQKAR